MILGVSAMPEAKVPLDIARLRLLDAFLADLFPHPAGFLAILLTSGSGRFVHFLAHLFADLLNG